MNRWTTNTHWLDDTVPAVGLANPMHWRPLDEDSDVEVPPWSWLVAPGKETPQ